MILVLGSFTGIRIGVATIKAFTDSLPIAKFTGVSSLEALAYNVQKDGLICSVIDCKNDNCYYALYNLQNGTYLEILPPSAASIMDLINTLKEYEHKPIQFVGDGVWEYKDKLSNTISNAQFLENSYNDINICNLALAGFNKLKSRKYFRAFPFIFEKTSSSKTIRSKIKFKKR